MADQRNGAHGSEPLEWPVEFMVRDYQKALGV